MVTPAPRSPLGAQPPARGAQGEGDKVPFGVLAVPSAAPASEEL